MELPTEYEVVRIKAESDLEASRLVGLLNEMARPFERASKLGREVLLSRPAPARGGEARA